MILDKFKLDGKVAIITGARTGLGRSMAIALAEAGADIVGVGRNEMPETEKAIKDIGKRFLFISADLSTIEPVNRIVEETLNEFGKIDILVNNAGIARAAPPIEFTEKDWDDVMDTNLKSVFFLSQAVAKRFLEQGTGGKIINLASMRSFTGSINHIAYAASKHGIIGITKTLANAWSKDGINCNAIAPGYMETEMTAPIWNDPQRMAKELSRISIGRWGKADDLQGAVVFLASEASNYMTGSTVCVDGGWLAK